MAFKSTFKCWINMIIAKIMLMSMLCVHSTVTIDCGPIFDPLKDLEYPYDPGTIKWPQTLGTVIYPDNRTVGSVAKFRCEKGYYVHGAKNATCEANGKWTISEKELFCERIRCIEPDFDIKHGKIETSAEYLSPQDYILNSIYWVTCDSGYISNGSAVRVCLVNDTNNDKLYKGIWSQRDENGTMLVGGDTVPECVQDTHIIVRDNYVNSTWENYINITDCNKANNLSPRENTVCGKTTEHVLLGVLGVLGVLCLILIVLLIIVVLKCKAMGKKICSLENKSITAGDRAVHNNDIEMQRLLGQSNTGPISMINGLIEEKNINIANLRAYNTEFEMQQLREKPGSELISMINGLIEEKNINIANLRAYNTEFEMQQLREKPGSELISMIDSLIEAKNINLPDLKAYNNDFEIQQLLDKSGPAIVPIIDKCIEEKGIKIADLQAYETVERELDQTKQEKAKVESELDLMKKDKDKGKAQLEHLDTLEELTKGRCAECVTRTKVEYHPLEKERGRLVNIIVNIQRQIAEFTNFESFILSNKETDTGAKLLKLIGKLGGLVEGCDISRSKLVLDEYGSEIQGKLEEVRDLRKSLKIPCQHCVLLEKDCEQKRYQIDRLREIITITKSELVGKILNFVDDVGSFKSESRQEDRGFNRLVGNILGTLENCGDKNDSDMINNYNDRGRPDNDTAYSQPQGQSTSGLQIPGSSDGAKTVQAKPTDTMSNPEIVIQSDTQATGGAAGDREEDDTTRESGNKIDKPVLVTSGSKTKNNADPHLNLDSKINLGD